MADNEWWMRVQQTYGWQWMVNESAANLWLTMNGGWECSKPMADNEWWMRVQQTYGWQWMVDESAANLWLTMNGGWECSKPMADNEWWMRVQQTYGWQWMVDESAANLWLTMNGELLVIENARRVKTYSKPRSGNDWWILAMYLSYVYSKHPIFRLTQEWLREVWSPRQGICLFYPLCGIFYFP